MPADGAARDPGTFAVSRSSGAAADFHARVVPAGVGHEVWMHRVDRPAIVLGSSQPIDHLDLDRCRAAGIEVVRRRSGGGAVLLVPDEVVWIDVLVPRWSPLWHDDVVIASWWLGASWVEALAPLGEEGLAVHRGALLESTWSRQVCFVGLGPGEVTRGGAKVVGISQRRTRDHARFQCAVHRRWCPEVMCDLLAPPGPTPAEIAPRVATIDATDDEVVEAVTVALDRALSGAVS